MLDSEIVDDRAPAAEANVPRASNPRNRRAKIVAALKHCMIDKGYAETSLTDLARAADMTVSHLLYYYAGKELVLLDLCDEVTARVLSDVTAHRDEPAEERIHVLVDNVFIRGAVSGPEMGIVRELIALAIHRPELRQRLSEFNRQMLNYLEDLFDKTPRHPGSSAHDAAEIASALWMGLFSNVEFDERLNESLARRLFRRTLLSLANLDSRTSDWSPPAPRAQRKPPVQRPRSRAGSKGAS